jgi:hypothetical protein
MVAGSIRHVNDNPLGSRPALRGFEMLQKSMRPRGGHPKHDHAHDFTALQPAGGPHLRSVTSRPFRLHLQQV